MIPYIKIFLDDEMYRSPTLCILEQLSEMNPEEYMSTTIGALCSSTETELQLKQDLLRVWLLHYLHYYPSALSSHFVLLCSLIHFPTFILIESVKCLCPELSSKFRDYIQTVFLSNCNKL